MQRAPRLVVTPDVFVRIPIAASETVIIAGPNLDEADTAFQQPSRDQTFAAEVFGS